MTCQFKIIELNPLSSRPFELLEMKPNRSSGFPTTSRGQFKSRERAEAKMAELKAKREAERGR